MLVLDLPPSVEQVIINKAYAQNLSVSEYILKNLPKDELDENLAWEYGKDLFGKYAESEDGTLSQNVKTLVQQKVFEKYGKNFD